MNDLEVTANNNVIVLTNKVIHPTATGRCYTQWAGSYTIKSSTRDIAQEDLDVLKDAGVFGCGQSVDARLVGNTINFSGRCDSGD
jgi:hypothetical protein